MSFSIHQIAEGTSFEGLGATFLDPPSHDFWPQALLGMLAPTAS